MKQENNKKQHEATRKQQETTRNNKKQQETIRKQQKHLQNDAYSYIILIDRVQT